MTLPVFAFAESAVGSNCDAGYRRAVTDRDGVVVSTVGTWGCDIPAQWVVPMKCPSCGARAQASYCGRHAAEAVGGEVRCLFCPDVIAEVIEDA